MRTFAMGAMYALPGTTNPTPIPIASLKDVTVDFKQTKKQFRGTSRVVIDVADAALDITLKIKNADFRAAAMQMLVPGATQTTGSLAVATGEAVTIAASVTVSQGAQFIEDGGVLDLTTGKWLTRVASAPITGQYSGPTVAGVYTFAAADVGHLAQITYSYNTPTTGNTLTYNNQLQSASQAFKVRLYNPFLVGATTKLVGYDFASVHFEHLSGAFKTEDFAEHDLEGFASQDMIGGTSLVFKAYLGD